MKSLAKGVLIFSLTVVTLAGCDSSLGIGGGSRKVGAAFLYFRPVFCSVPAYRPGGPTSPGVTVATGSPPSPSVCAAANAAEIASTSLPDDSPTSTVILPYYDNSVRYVLGPADLDGSVIARTSVMASGPGGYAVALVLTPAGTAEMDHVASERYPLYAADPGNPPYDSFETIELNGTVVLATAMEAPRFNGTVVITGTAASPFTKQQADGLAEHIDLARFQHPLQT